MIAAAMVICLVWLVYASNRLPYISGADAGYLAYYDAALSGQDAEPENPYPSGSKQYLGWERYASDGWYDAVGEYP